MTTDSEPSTDGWKPIEQRIALGSFIAVTLLIGIFLLRDASAFVNSSQDELVGHLGASAGFTIAGAGTLIILRRTPPSLLMVLLTGIAITVAGELAQGLVPDRGVQLRDFVAGFGGVLLTGICIELVLRGFSLLRALRMHASVAIIGALGLAAILAFDLAPETILVAAPDGESCPLTQIVGEGERVTIGEQLQISDGCVQTEVGGFGLLGPDDATTLTDDTVLISSQMKELAATIRDSERLVVRTEIVTRLPDNLSRRTGTLVQIDSDEFGLLLLVRANTTRVEVYGPITPDPFRAAALAQSLKEDTRHIIEVELDEGTLTVRVDGEAVATTAVNPAWVDALEEDDLRLFIGNTRARSLPYHGVIEWLELDS